MNFEGKSGTKLLQFSVRFHMLSLIFCLSEARYHLPLRELAVDLG